MKAKKRHERLKARRKAYAALCGEHGWKGEGELPKRWGGFNRPGSIRK